MCRNRQVQYQEDTYKSCNDPFLSLPISDRLQSRTRPQPTLHQRDAQPPLPILLFNQQPPAERSVKGFVLWWWLGIAAAEADKVVPLTRQLAFVSGVIMYGRTLVTHPGIMHAWLYRRSIRRFCVPSPWTSVNKATLFQLNFELFTKCKRLCLRAPRKFINTL